jgi:flavin-dependent dehydrogenase
VNRLDVFPADWESIHKPVHEFLGSWGSSSMFSRDSIFDARGHSLALDRGAFDRELAAAAVSQGATLVTNAKFLSAAKLRDQWTIEIEQGGEHFTVCGSFMAMCIGRTGRPVASISAKRRTLDRLFCLGLRIANCPGDFGASIESYDRGWVYSVLLNSGELVVNVCTEDVGKSERRFGLLLEELACCPIAASRVAAAQAAKASDVHFFIANASSAVTRPAVGEGWCLAGDCAQSMDPLSSSGIMNALRHAEMIFQCLMQSRTIAGADLSAYSRWLDQNYTEYLTTRQQFYGLERRWPSPFWQKRQIISEEKLELLQKY